MMSNKPRLWMVMGVLILTVVIISVATPSLLPSREERIVRGLEEADLYGASPEQVIAYLDKAGIYHEGCQRKTDTESPHGEIVAIVRNASTTHVWGIPFAQDLWIFFRFDRSDRLVSYTTKHRVNAP